jgi:hypothetical protein
MPASGDGMFYNFIRTVGLQTVASFMPGLTAHFLPLFSRKLWSLIKVSELGGLELWELFFSWIRRTLGFFVLAWLLLGYNPNFNFPNCYFLKSLG